MISHRSSHLNYCYFIEPSWSEIAKRGGLIYIGGNFARDITMGTKNERALTMLSTALEMERKGLEFYEKTVAATTNEMGRQVFEKLRQDEVAHMARIGAIWASLDAGGSVTPEWTKFAPSVKDLRAFFRGVVREHGKKASPDMGDVAAIDTGIAFERRAVEYYEEQLATAADPVERKFLELMVAEEKSHLDTLTDMKFYLTDPEGWFIEQQGTGFDGA